MNSMLSFLSLFHRVIVKDTLQNRFRTLLTLTGVALGIAVVVGVHLANERAIDSFNDSLGILNGRADLQISANGLDLDETLIGELAWVWDVGVMAAIVEGRLDLSAGQDPTNPLDLNDRPNRRPAGQGSVRLFGIDLLSDAPFRTYLLDGDTGQNRSELGMDIAREDFIDLLVEPNVVILPAVLADELGVTVGDAVSFLVSNRLQDFVVGAVLADAGIARAFDGKIVFMDIAAAQLTSNRVGRIDRIEILLDDPTTADTVAGRIRLQLPDSVVVYRPEDTQAETERMTRAFRYNLRALSYIALIVGMILIYNTMNIAVVRRRSEIGALRTLGTSRATIKWMFLIEAILFGVIGAGLGIGFGEILARVTGALVSQTISMLYIGTSSTSAAGGIDWIFYIEILILGGVLAAASGAGPALRATNISPVATLRKLGSGATPRSATFAGIAIICVGIGFSFAPAIGGFPFLGYVAGVAFIVGFGLLSPVLAKALLSAGRNVVTRLMPAEGRLAIQTIEGSLGRVVVAVISLAIAVAMLSSVAIMVASFRDTVVVWVDQTLEGDLYLRPAASGGDGGRNLLEAETVEILSSIPEIAAIDRFRAIGIDYDGFRAVLGAGEFQTLANHGRLLFMDGRRTSDVASRLIGADRVVVSEPFSVRHGIGLGDTIRLPTPKGTIPFEVESVFYDYSTEAGLIVMDRSTYISNFDDSGISNVAVYLQPGADANGVRTDIAARLPGVELRIATNQELRTQVLRVFDQTFQITYALELIALAVAMLGIANTLAALIIERRPELAMLRFIGAARSQIRRVIVLESGLIGVLGALIGLTLGVLLSLILVYVINFQSFGWTIQFTMPVGFLAQSLIVVLLATLVAGLYPASLALRMDPIEGIRAE